MPLYSKSNNMKIHQQPSNWVCQECVCMWPYLLLHVVQFLLQFTHSASQLLFHMLLWLDGSCQLHVFISLCKLRIFQLKTAVSQPLGQNLLLKNTPNLWNLGQLNRKLVSLTNLTKPFCSSASWSFSVRFWVRARLIVALSDWTSSNIRRRSSSSWTWLSTCRSISPRRVSCSAHMRLSCSLSRSWGKYYRGWL